MITEKYTIYFATHTDFKIFGNTENMLKKLDKRAYFKIFSTHLSSAFTRIQALKYYKIWKSPVHFYF